MVEVVSWRPVGQPKFVPENRDVIRLKAGEGGPLADADAKKDRYGFIAKLIIHTYAYII